MRKKRQLWLSVFPVLIVLCSLWLCLPCLCADSSEAESEVEILPEVGSATAAAAINTNKIYRIQNIAANTSGRPSFLTDDNGAPSLRTQNSDRSQLWILTSVPGSTQYRLTPLSRTTLAYSGTDVGLYAYGEDECVVIDSMTNGSVYFSGTGWYIYPSGTNYYIYSSVTFSNDERILGRAGANASGVKLYYDEDVLDLEDWIQWKLIPYGDRNEFPANAFSGLSVPFDVFQTDKFDLKTMISVSDQVTDQRVQFTMTTTPNALITKAGSLTVKNGKDFFSPETPTRGSITVSSFENPSTRMNFYVNFKKIDGDECLLWDVLQVDYSKVFLSLTYVEGDFSLEYPYESNWQACTFEYDSSRNKYILRYHRQYLQANTATNTVTLTPTLNSSCYWSLEGIFPDPEYGVKYRASFYYQAQTGRRYLYIASVDHDNNPSTPLIFETKLDNNKNYLYVTRTTMDDEDRLGLPLQYLAVPLTTDEANHMGEDVTFRSEPLGSVMYKLGAVNHYAVDARNEEYNQNEIFSALDGGRFVIFRGHGDAGKIVLKSSTVFTDHEEEDLHTVTAQEIFNRYNNSEDSLSNIDLLIWGSCCSADSQDAPHTNLVDVSFDVGAKIVVGFKGTVRKDDVNQWVNEILTLYADYCRNSSPEYPFTNYISDSIRYNNFQTTMNFDIVIIKDQES